MRRETTEERSDQRPPGRQVTGSTSAGGPPGALQTGSTWMGWLVALVPLGLTIGFASLIGPVAGGLPLFASAAWVPSLGVDFAVHIDGLALMFALLISGVGSLVFIYAGAYLAGHPQIFRFYLVLLLFMVSMLGLVLADNLLLLFAFWELTGLTSFLLIGFDHERPAARAAALQALLVTGAGELAMLAGLIMLGVAGGTLQVSELLTRGDVIRADSLYPAILLLVFAGAFTKSAQVPFHFWLPNAMEAPTPVSAYLHSATMVKAGVYLLARLSPVLGGTMAWEVVVPTVGVVTMVVGAWLAIRHTDLKRILAYSTLSALGTLVMLLGMGTAAAITAAMVFLLGHALYKGALFLVAGAIDHATGTRDVEALGGLRRAMPITAVAGGLAALSMIGLPPLFGFIGKELTYEAALAEQAGIVLVCIAVAVNVLLAVAAGMAGIGPFFGPACALPKHPHEAPIGLWIGAAVLAAIGLLFGIGPGLVEPLLSAAVAGVLGRAAPVSLSLWHGFNLVLVLSVLTLAGAAVAYRIRAVLRRAAVRSDFGPRWGPARGYDLALAGVDALARRQTSALQNGSLHQYLSWILVSTVGLVGFSLIYRGQHLWAVRAPEVAAYEVGIALLILVAALFAVLSTSRMGAVAALGLVGYGVALIYVMFGAPDLAMTQILIETLTVILFVLVFSFLPGFTMFSSGPTRARDAVVALAAGALMTTLVLVAAPIRFDPAIPDFYAEQSLPGGHGRNIVNVILVDFRALDTLGEITVFAIAAVGVYALLKLRLTEGPPSRSRPRADSRDKGRTEE
jgi:multicomponent Na+:H+ antiporter subunit A